MLNLVDDQYAQRVQLRNVRHVREHLFHANASGITLDVVSSEEPVDCLEKVDAQLLQRPKCRSLKPQPNNLGQAKWLIVSDHLRI